jgi:hypothetical protein
MMSKEPREEDVSISASVYADEMHVKVPARTRVTFVGDGRVVTRRVGIPPTGAVAGATYRNAKVATDITSRLVVTRPPRRK